MKLASQHTSGIYSNMELDGPEIGTLVIIVDKAKNLPNRRTMGKQDPYCNARLGKEAKKTHPDRRGGQTPKWFVMPCMYTMPPSNPQSIGTKNFDLPFTIHQTITPSRFPSSTRERRRNLLAKLGSISKLSLSLVEENWNCGKILNAKANMLAKFALNSPIMILVPRSRNLPPPRAASPQILKVSPEVYVSRASDDDHCPQIPPSPTHLVFMPPAQEISVLPSIGHSNIPQTASAGTATTLKLRNW